MGFMETSTEIYKELLEILTDGIYFTDAERRILYWNKGAEAKIPFLPTYHKRWQPKTPEPEWPRHRPHGRHEEWKESEEDLWTNA